MVGKIELADGIQAELSDEGEWTCEDEVVQKMLNLRFNPSEATGVAVAMPYGAMSLSMAAQKLGGKVVSSPKVVPLKPGELS